MSFYAVVIDDDFQYAPMVRLIRVGPAPGPLLATKWFEPYSPYSKCDKVGFAITQGAPLILTSTINNQPVPAHVCQLTAR
jgi:hypothetical protein